MESDRSNKRRGFAKSKLVKSFHCGAKTKMNSPSPSSAAAVGFIIVTQDQVFPPHQRPKVAFVVPDRSAKLESFYGSAGEDEAVDAKAATYISTVQERFRLELVQ